MKKQLKLWILAMTTILFYANLNASHVLGGDITYTPITADKYKVIYKLYRECAGVPLVASEIIFKVSAASGNVDATITANRTSIRDISTVCSKDTLPCSPNNKTTNTGTEEHVFEAIVDFTQSPYSAIKANSCKVLFSFSICCRAGVITTLSPGNFYLDAMVDLCAVGSIGNASPIFKTKPVRNMCCYTPFAYNNGCVELAEGDSLSFELSSPLKGLNDPEVYTGNFSSSIPVTPYCPPNPGVINCQALPSAKPPRGFYFDKETGDVVYTPTKCDEAAVITFKINEWRKDSMGVWQLIGFVKRESTWIVQTCPNNNPPYLTGNNKYSVCEGNKLCFTIDSKDDLFLPNQTVADTVTMTWDTGIANASFTILDPTAREKSAQFCWQTSLGDARPAAYRMTVQLNDNFCPGPGLVTRTYIVNVKPKARAKMQVKKLFKGGLELYFSPLDGSSIYSYNHVIRDSSNSGTPLHTGFNKQRDTFVFSSPGKYVVEYTVNNAPSNCPTVYTDTLIVTASDLTSVVNYRNIDLNLFPNPGNGRIQFESSSMDVHDAWMKVYAVDGRMVTEKQLENAAADLSVLAKGVYTIELKVEGYRVYRQLIIE